MIGQLQLKEQWLLFICNLTWASAVHPGCTLLVCDGSRFSLEKILMGFTFS